MTTPTPVADASSNAPRDAGVTPDAQASCTSAKTDTGPASLMMCGGECVDIDTDNANCGGCDQACGIT
jgi:hypothetical protein